MAAAAPGGDEGGGAGRRPGRDHPDFNPFFGRRPPDHQHNEADIGNQGRHLLTRFIHDRMAQDGLREIPAADQLIEPGTPSGPPVERINEVATALKRIGDELDRDESLQRLIGKISPDAPRQTFLNVAKEIFADGNFNWGRVVALFYFAYKMVVKSIQSHLSNIPFLQSIVEWVVHFIVEYVASWIIQRGGWEAIFEYFGASQGQFMVVFLSGFAASACFILWKTFFGR